MHPSDPVNRLMTDAVLTVDIDDPAGEVLRLFAAYPVHHLPVLESHRVVGMLSSADVMKLEMFLPKGSGPPIEYLNQRMKVRPLLRGPAITVAPSEPVEAAARLMALHGVHALAVVNGEGNLLGILTTTDIMHAALGGHGDAAAPRQLDRASLEQQCARLSERVALLEKVRAIASRYMQAGQDQRLHAELRRALEAVASAGDRG